MTACRGVDPVMNRARPTRAQRNRFGARAPCMLDGMHARPATSPHPARCARLFLRARAGLAPGPRRRTLVDGGIERARGGVPFFVLCPAEAPPHGGASSGAWSACNVAAVGSERMNLRRSSMRNHARLERSARAAGGGRGGQWREAVGRPARLERSRARGESAPHRRPRRQVRVADCATRALTAPAEALYARESRRWRRNLRIDRRWRACAVGAARKASPFHRDVRCRHDRRRDAGAHLVAPLCAPMLVLGSMIGRRRRHGRRRRPRARASGHRRRGRRAASAGCAVVAVVRRKDAAKRVASFESPH